MSESPTGQDGPSEGPGPAGAPGPVRSARRQFTATMLVLEALVVLFATLVAYGLRAAPPAVVWTLGGALALSLLLAAGAQGRPGGLVVGSLLQVPVLLGGLLLPPVAAPLMVAVGVVFVALWVAAVRLGGRIDRERAERAAG
ncbi:MAG TPA: DUF4233 domain-containing protein [Actinotalea sp.]|nr:DUF4233 domain-containing protein [Actinotalea sp.]